MGSLKRLKPVRTGMWLWRSTFVHLWPGSELENQLVRWVDDAWVARGNQDLAGANAPWLAAPPCVAT
jgi:hypothetical protein